MRWFFSPDGDEVLLRARLEDESRIGDAVLAIKAGEAFHDLTFAQLRRLGAGIIDEDFSGQGASSRSAGSA